MPLMSKPRNRSGMNMIFKLDIYTIWGGGDEEKKIAILFAKYYGIILKRSGQGYPPGSTSSEI